MKKVVFVIGMAVLLAACVPERTQAYDQCLRQQLFQQCMSNLPKGPERIHNSNDWDEVVSECGEQARMLSVRKAVVVKPECRVDW